MALAIVPKVSSIFSLFGSMWIIIEIATEKNKRRVPYHRLLLAMSVYDVLESIWNFLSTWPIPKGSPYVVWAYGNTASCTAQGFFLTLSSAVPLYNAMLSYYYVLVIKYNYTDRRLRSCVEPAMHIFCFVWAFGTAVASAAGGLINNADLWCWIAPLPHDCLDSWEYGVDNENPCIRGDNIWVYRFGFYFIPLWISIAIGTVCTYIVYNYVYLQDVATLQYRRPDRKVNMWGKVKSFRNDVKNRFSPGIPSSAARDLVGDIKGGKRHPSTKETTKYIIDDSGRTDLVGDSSRTDLMGGSGRTGGDSHLPIEETTNPTSEKLDQPSPSVDRKPSGGTGLGSVPEESQAYFPGEAPSNEQRPKLLQDNTPHNLSRSMRNFTEGREPTGAWSIALKSDSVQSNITVDSADVAAIQDEIAKRAVKAEKEASRRQNLRGEKLRGEQDCNRPGMRQRYQEWKERREQYARDMPHTVEVFHQALFYLGTFYLTHVWSTTNRLVQAITADSSFFLLVMHAFFDPFQGFLNYWVYQRPRYTQMHKKYPDLSFFQICRIILRFTYMGEYVVPERKEPQRELVR